MTNLELVKKITKGFLANRNDANIVNKYFAPTFKHTANGANSDINGYKAHVAKYTRKYVNFKIHKWDEAYECGDRIVAAYTLIGVKKNGSQEKIAVIATWQLADGKVVALREVDAKI